jgi:hypothetical protein
VLEHVLLVFLEQISCVINLIASPKQVDFFINGSYVGRAFSLNAPYISPLYPLISFGKGNQVSIVWLCILSFGHNGKVEQQSGKNRVMHLAMGCKACPYCENDI